MDIPRLDEAELVALAQKKVCVTGAGGYVASHIVARLLQAGSEVHATVRASNSAKHLLTLPGAAVRLKIFEADLLQQGSFDDAVSGCSAVIHTASPYQINLPRGKEKDTVVDPAIDGIRNVLGTVARCPSVNTVVLTSSTAAGWTDPHERGREHEFSEADWNLILQQPHAEQGPLAYFYAKAAAEKEAYTFHAQVCSYEQTSRWRLVSILPGAVYGPPLSARADGESVSQMARMLKGQMPIFAPLVGMGMCDVRDVAAAHCRAVAHQEASGRYLINARAVYFLPLAARVLREEYHSLRSWLPFAVAPAWAAWLVGPLFGLPRAITKTHYARKPAINCSRAANDLSMTSYIKPECSAKDMAEALIKLGIASI